MAAVALACVASATWAQKSASDGIAEYRAMLQDGNPADLFEAKGEDLWKQARGPKKTNLMQCAEQIRSTPYGKGEQTTITALATWVAAESRGLKFNLPQAHAEEKRMFDLGKKLFFFRSGPHDFACSTCHGQDDKRIRLQDLPNLTTAAGAGMGFGAWPAYRVSNGQMWSMQLRLNDCYRQQRFPYAVFGSDASAALGVYLGVTAKDVATTAPAIRR
jgi:sulfur-oxidizing protein SoxA